MKTLGGPLLVLLLGLWAPVTHGADNANTEAMKQLLRSMQENSSTETREQTDQLVDDLSRGADRLREADRCNQSCISGLSMRLRPGESRRCRDDSQCRSCLTACNR